MKVVSLEMSRSLVEHIQQSRNIHFLKNKNYHEFIKSYQCKLHIQHTAVLATEHSRLCVYKEKERERERERDTKTERKKE